jgi:hypothetical protein
MRKGVSLITRDYEIFGHLRHGPATIPNIFNNFFDNGNGNKKTRERVMIRRLRKLEKEKLIKAMYNPRIKSTIYVLDKAGAECVADKLGLEVSNVRSHFPKTADIFHELYVSGIAKVISKEIDEFVECDHSSILFEAFLKKENGGKRGVYYPDLKVRISTPSGIVNYDIEVDCGNISKADFFGKISSFESTILIVVKTEARLDLLHRYLRMIGTWKTVYITLVDNILGKDGFFHCKWRTPTSQYVSLIKE